MEKKDLTLLGTVLSGLVRELDNFFKLLVSLAMVNLLVQIGEALRYGSTPKAFYGSKEIKS